MTAVRLPALGVYILPGPSVSDALVVVVGQPLLALPLLTAAAALALLVAVAPRRPQPRLRARAVALVPGDDSLAPVVFNVELAKTPAQQRTGLMHRSSVPPGTGMLFRWRRPMRSAIWMRNVRIPLDLVFLDAAGVVISVVPRRPRGIAMSGLGFRSAALLELPGGVCAALGVAPGWRLLDPAPGSDAAQAADSNPAGGSTVRPAISLPPRAFPIGRTARAAGRRQSSVAVLFATRLRGVRSWLVGFIRRGAPR
jgi:uncharacterized membrane protein (UPF0127 family)